MRLRKVKYYGKNNGWRIRLRQTDIEDFKLKDGDMVDIDDIVIKTLKNRRFLGRQKLEVF